MEERVPDNWPALEVKIRNLMKEILEPSLGKLKQTEFTQSTLQKMQRELKDRISNTDTKLETVNSRVPSIEPLNRRISEQFLRLATVESDVKHQCESLKNQMESISSALGSISSQVFSINKQSELYKKNLTEYASGFSSLKKYVEEKVQELKSEVKQPLETQSEANVHFENRIRQIEKNLEGISKEVAYVDFVNKKHEHDLKEGISLFEGKSLGLDKFTEKLHDQLNYLRKTVQGNEFKMKNEVQQIRAGFKEEIENFAGGFMKTVEKNFAEMMEFVLIEPRYKKKMQELRSLKENLRVDGCLSSQSIYVGSGLKPLLQVSEAYSLVQDSKENMDTLRIRAEIQTSQDKFEKLPISSDLKLTLEDLQNDTETLKQQISSLSQSTEESIRSTSKSLLSSKLLSLAIKSNLDSKIASTSLSLESQLKFLIQDSITAVKEELTKSFTLEGEKRNYELQKIQQSSQELETLLKQSSFEFSNFVSNRKRENSDVKLDLKRIYNKLDMFTKENQKAINFAQEVRKSVKLMRDLLSLQVSLQKTETGKGEERKNSQQKLMIVQEKGLKLEMLEKQEGILDSLNECLDISTPINISSISQRSFTPELPVLRRHK